MKRTSLIVLCFAIWTAQGWSQSAERKAQTIGYLHQLQATDGGFLPALVKPGVPPAKSSLRATLAGLRALKYFEGEPRNKVACARFVEKCFDPTVGGFADHPGGKPDVATTAVGVMALVELKQSVQEYTGPVLGYLAAKVKTFEDIRIAAAAVEALQKQPAEAGTWLQEVEKLRNTDGGFGQGAGIARATGGAVVAILRLGGKVNEPAPILRAMRAGQREDGAFGKLDSQTSDLESSYRVMRAFFMLKEKPDIARCRAFVARCRNADGGYGVAPGQPSQAGTTYYAAIILHWLAELEQR